MSIVEIIVMVMVVTILATITLAVMSYGVFRMRERRGPAAQAEAPAGPSFFERVRLPTAQPAAER